MNALRRHLSFTNALASLALFVALAGGTAYALNTVGSGDVINESLLSQDIKNREVATDDIAIGAVFGSRIRDNGIVASHVVDNALTGEKLTGSAEHTYSGGKLFAPNGDASVIALPDMSGEILSAGPGSREVVLPLGRQSVLYGRDLAVTKVNYCFRTMAMTNKLDSVELRRAYGGATTVIASDTTDRDNTTTQCFDLVPPAPAATDEALSLKFTLGIANDGFNTFVGPARLTLAPAN